MLVFLRQNVGEKKSLTRLWALKAYPADLFSIVPQYQPAPPRCSARARSWIVWFSFFYHSLSFILSPLSLPSLSLPIRSFVPAISRPFRARFPFFAEKQEERRQQSGDGEGAAGAD